MNCDEIEINRLQVSTHIGVPDEERATPQTLWISAWMQPSSDFSTLDDKVENTIDYYQASIALTQLAAARPRHLIETLATEAAELLLDKYPLKSVTVKIEKQILPNTDFVAVKTTRHATN